MTNQLIYIKMLKSKATNWNQTNFLPVYWWCKLPNFQNLLLKLGEKALKKITLLALNIIFAPNENTAFQIRVEHTNYQHWQKWIRLFSIKL